MAGKADAQRLLYKSYYSYAKNICSRYVSSKEEAEEIMNDGFVKIFNKLALFDHDHHFRPWLKTIMINTALDYYRKNQKYQLNSSIEDYSDISIDDNVIEKLSGEEILTLIQELTPGFRTVFVLYVVEGYNHREIAEKLGINEGTSKSNLAKARAKLQAMVFERYPELYSKYSNN